MANYRLKNTGDPTDGKDAVNKNYADLSLPKAGGLMSGHINMNSNEILGLTSTPQFGSSAVSKTYVNSVFFKLNGSSPLSGNMDTGTKNITNLAVPTAANDAANKKYVDKGHVAPSGLTNVFAYLMDDTDESSSEIDHITVVDVSDFAESPHLVYKKAYKINIGAAEATNYRERIGFNLHPSAAGDYTMVAEYFPPLARNVSVTAAIDAGSRNNFLIPSTPTVQPPLTQKSSFS